MGACLPKMLLWRAETRVAPGITLLSLGGPAAASGFALLVPLGLVKLGPCRPFRNAAPALLRAAAALSDPALLPAAITSFTRGVVT